MNRRLIVGFAILAVTVLGFRAATSAEEAKPPETVVPLNRDVPRHKTINERAKQGNVDLLFVGDSITQGWEGAGKEVWKTRYEKRKAMNAGIGGDRTQHVLWRLENGNIEGLKPKAAVLMIGTNNMGANSPEDIAAGIKAVIQKLRTSLPETKLLVLGVFPRGEKPDEPLRKKNEAINKLIEDVGDGKMVQYLNINARLMNADGTQNKEIMPDLVHLSPRGYEIWGEAIEEPLAAMLGEK